MYFNNHTHTEYSNAQLGFPDVINKMSDVIQRSYDLGLRGINISDHEGIVGHIQALQYYNNMQKDRPFTLSLGNEIYLISEEEDAANRDAENPNKTPYYHFVLTALDTEGHAQLRKISTRAWLRAYMYHGIMRKPTYYTDIENIIGDNKGHIICSTACLGGYLPKQILQWQQGDNEAKKNIHRFITWLVATFGKENVYLEIQPMGEGCADQGVVNEQMLVLSKAYDIPIIPTTDAHYLSKETAYIHKTLLLSQDGDREVDEFYKTAYLMSDEELRSYLRQQFDDATIDQMYQNTIAIADRVQGYDLQRMPDIPRLPRDKVPEFEVAHLFKEYYDTHPEFEYYSRHENVYDRYFFYQIECGLKRLVVDKGKDVSIYIDRLEKEMHELHIISDSFKSSMASYYVSMQQIINLIWESDSLSMPARGSGAGFLICYLLEITQIDPVPLGEYMPFWRHLN